MNTTVVLRSKGHTIFPSLSLSGILVCRRGFMEGEGCVDAGASHEINSVEVDWSEDLDLCVAVHSPRPTRAEVWLLCDSYFLVGDNLEGSRDLKFGFSSFPFLLLNVLVKILLSVVSIRAQRDLRPKSAAAPFWWNCGERLLLVVLVNLFCFNSSSRLGSAKDSTFRRKREQKMKTGKLR